MALALRTIAQGGVMADKDTNRIQNGILGDINPISSDHVPRRGEQSGGDDEDIRSMEGGSQRGQSHHPGSRDVTEGATGGAGTEVGGTRNYRQGSGHAGGDIGSRVE
jgi:hypothetical protein